jgi:hypothetical protein
MEKFIIQWDGKKGYPFRVATSSGIALGYFKTTKDAQAFCLSQAA